MKEKNYKSNIMRTILMFSFIMIFFLAIIIAYYLSLRSETREKLIKNGEIIAMDSAQTIEKFLDTGMDTIQLTGYTLDTMIKDGSSNKEILDFIVSESVAVEMLLKGATTGLYAYVRGEYMDGAGWSPEEGYDPTKRPWYAGAKAAAGSIAVVDPYLDSMTGDMTITLAKTLSDGESVVAVDISMKELQKITEELMDEGSSDMELILDEAGNVITHSRRGEVGKNYLNGEGLGHAIAERLYSSDERFFSLKYADKEYIVYAIPLENDWICLSVIDSTPIYQRLKMPLVLTAASSLFIISVLIVIMLGVNRKNAEAEKNAIETERAVAASEAKSAFLSNMSHEIRTPINAVLGMNEMILRECADDKILDYSMNIKNAGKMLLGIVNDVLDFSKIEAGKLEIMPVDYDLAEVLSDLVNMVYERAAAKGIRLELQFQKDTPHLLCGDEVRIRQVIANLLTNAVKYTEKGSVIFGVSYVIPEEDHESVDLIISVEDTGIGIREEDLNRLSSVFVRLEEKKNRNIEGTGLGISITKRLLGMMGSELEVESSYGVGSRFGFTLRQKIVSYEPLGDYVETHREAVNVIREYKESFTAPTCKVLAVDDNAINLMVLSSLLKKTGVQIDTAEGGEEAIAMSLVKKYDVILLDHMMPEKDGIETLHDIRNALYNHNRTTPVICLTANAISGAKERYMREGFDDYITKPVESSELERVLLRFLPPDKVNRRIAEEEPKEKPVFPEELEKLGKEGLIDPEWGLENNGDMAGYLKMIRIYCEVSDEKTGELEKLYAAADLKNYTIKIHALKSSLRLIGVRALAEEAQMLEDAGKKNDEAYIINNHESFMEKVRTLKEKLQNLVKNGENKREKLPQAGMKLVSEKLRSIRMAAVDMDCDRLEEIFSEMKKYSLPEDLEKLWRDLEKASGDFDYDLVLKLLNDQYPETPA